MREAQVAAQLRSPHIAVAYDLVEHEPGLFIAMEYVEGELLSARIARGALPVADSLDIAMQVADALDEAHGLGIVHRDIKSSNLIDHRAAAGEGARLRSGQAGAVARRRSPPRRR